MATIVTNAGLAVITAQLLASTYSYLGWGTGAGTAAVSDTALFTEASEARTDGTQSQETTTVTDDSYQVVGTIVADSAKTITNAALFSASTAGTMLIKGDFTGVALDTGESIQLTVKMVAS